MQKLVDKAKVGRQDTVRTRLYRNVKMEIKISVVTNLKSEKVYRKGVCVCRKKEAV